MSHGFLKRLPTALAIGLLLLPVPVRAHGAIHDRIDALTERLAEAPDDGNLYLKRAELYRVDGSWEAALADYDRAARLAPGLVVVALARADMLYEAGRPAPALEAVGRYLVAEPDSYDALVLQGRILAALTRHDESAAALDKALARTGPATLPDPDVYLELARSLAAAGRADAAITRLEEGIDRLGRLVSLERLAIELERSMGRFDAALARVDRFIAETPRPEFWLLLRGRIASQAGTLDVAREAFEAALTAVAALPPRQRTPRIHELEREARHGLTEIQQGRSVPEPGPRPLP